ncbi:hypothetical protein [Nocardiopsis halophila]|uniref:hypothetical protein n=1 Tax=Nocardiopsis halophila TaxID=141692 RepID=UPI00034DE7B0|nr:hypothetical protein [Nocardiopsis halophila]
MAADSRSRAGRTASEAQKKRIKKAQRKASSERAPREKKEREEQKAGSAPMRKVSVTLPAELTDAVQDRVGRGRFSSYVADAVARQLEHDLLIELADQMDKECGPVPEELVREAEAEWPDV